MIKTVSIRQRPDSVCGDVEMLQDGQKSLVINKPGEKWAEIEE
jgi:hypothetical protein